MMPILSVVLKVLLLGAAAYGGLVIATNWPSRSNLARGDALSAQPPSSGCCR